MCAVPDFDHDQWPRRCAAVTESRPGVLSLTVELAGGEAVCDVFVEEHDDAVELEVLACRDQADGGQIIVEIYLRAPLGGRRVVDLGGDPGQSERMTVTVQHHRLGISWHERSAMARAAHAVKENEHVWLIDPFEDAAALSAAAELGEPSAVIQLLDRHNRDCAAIAQRLGVPLLRLPATVAGSPFEVVKVMSQRWWRELALWWPAERTLIVAEAVGTAPAFKLGRTLGVHPMLRLTPPGALQAFSPETVLVGHGPSIESGGAAALSDALANARTDMPKLLLQIPSLIRGG